MEPAIPTSSVHLESLRRQALEPSTRRCSPRSIRRTMPANVTNSCCLQLSNGFRSKNGMTLSRRSSASAGPRTPSCGRWSPDGSHGSIHTQAEFGSGQGPDARLTSWLTRNSGTSCQPTLVLGFRWIADVKASFSVDEARDVRIQSFLLIGRTCRIVTALSIHDPNVHWVFSHVETSSAGYNRRFQHLAKFIDSAVCPLSHDVLNPARVPL